MRIIIRLLIIAACTLAGAVWLDYKGPIPVIRMSTPLPEAAPFWYMVLAFPVLGMLVADLVDLYQRRGLDRASIELAVQVGLLIAISNLRLGMNLPISGHSLLVSYFLARRVLLRPYPPAQQRLELAFGIAAFAAIAYPKLFWWNDPLTLIVGVIVGTGLAGLSRALHGWPDQDRPDDRD